MILPAGYNDTCVSFLCLYLVTASRFDRPFSNFSTRGFGADFMYFSIMCDISVLGIANRRSLIDLMYPVKSKV